MTQKIKKILISLFIIINLMMMIRAQIDDTTPITKFIYQPITYIQNYLSIWRGWQMFAPNPLRSNSFIDAKIIFKDKSELIWNFPRPTDSLAARYIWGERYRKYSVDGLRLDDNSHLWPDAAKFILRDIAKEHFKKRPIKVILRRRWQNIPDWNEYFIKHRQRLTIPFNTYEFYTFEVL